MATCDPRDIDPAYNLHATSPNIVVAEGGPYTIQMESAYQNSITFHSAGEEMFRCGPDGFFVRGKKVEQDDKEDEARADINNYDADSKFIGDVK
jgi:hypothetical protein